MAEALGKSMGELRVVILDKPRHAELIERVRALGASITTPSNGDVAGALSALLPDGDADLLMGIGGTPEGLMTACAARALGGGMQIRLAPQSAAEADALRRAGMSPERRLRLDELIWGEAFFVATGVSGGALLRRPWREDGVLHTDSLVVADGGVERLVQPVRRAPLRAARFFASAA